jgi:hypothetical protein
LLLSIAFVAAQLTSVAAVLLAVAVAGWTAVLRLLERRGLWRELRWILLGSVVLNLAGIWWGLPSHWVAIETAPVYVLYGLSQHFSHGWYEAYPPLQYYVLALAGSPVLLLQSLGLMTIYDPAGAAVLLVVYRLVSVAAAAGTVILTCLCGEQAFGRRAGLFAAAVVALMAPFLYYAKTANVDVPYLFWYALSLFFYLRLLAGQRWLDYVGFAAAATAAICTKDQAYALQSSVPVPPDRHGDVLQGHDGGCRALALPGVNALRDRGGNHGEALEERPSHPRAPRPLRAALAGAGEEDWLARWHPGGSNPLLLPPAALKLTRGCRRRARGPRPEPATGRRSRSPATGPAG